jgi:hypothetical protein
MATLHTAEKDSGHDSCSQSCPVTSHYTVFREGANKPEQAPRIPQPPMQEDRKAMFREKESNTTVLENLEASSRVAESFAKKPKGAAKRQGLCCNCDLQETCLYKGDGVALWYCEEYQ